VINDDDSRIDVLVPSFHVTAHSISCMQKYNPRKNEGTANVDGESCERAWSYLGTTSIDS
jgi:hypothetical protein